MDGPELAVALAARLGGHVTDLWRLTRRQSRETWRFDVNGRPLLLRLHPARAPASEAMAREAHLHRAAAEAGVPVPAIVDVTDDPTVLGAPFIIMERVEGETLAPRVLRSPEFAAVRPRLARQCGEILTRVHAVPLDAVPGLDHDDQLARFPSLLARAGEGPPAFDLALRWLEANRPPAGRTALVHGDFRVGNLVVGPDGVRAVLHWELAHAGDPLEDLGWLCVRSWRFGIDQSVGGLGPYDELLAGYGAGEGEAARLHWWEVLGNLKWGVLCLVQAASHAPATESPDVRATLHREVAAVEKELSSLIEAGSWPSHQPLP